MHLREHLRRVLAERPRDRLRIPGFTAAAVLVPLIQRDGGISLPFIHRPDEMPTHAGQIGFPGGRREAGDADARATALREAHEELGIPPGAVEVLGELDDAATPVGFVITPVCGWIAQPPPFRPQQREVAGWFEVALEELRDPACFAVRGERRFADRIYPLLEYRVGGHTVWGATARIVRSLLDRLPPGP